VSNTDTSPIFFASASSSTVISAPPLKNHDAILRVGLLASVRAVLVAGCPSGIGSAEDALDRSAPLLAEQPSGQPVVRSVALGRVLFDSPLRGGGKLGSC
jgi:hypothetical protein